MRVADLNGRSVAVWGTGPEGRAAVLAIAPHRPSRLIAVDDSADFLAVPWAAELAALAPLAGGDHAFPALVTAEVVVRSPDIPQTHPWVTELRERGVTITSGSALWMADNAARTIGVTGSKGKSTTSSLISRLLTAVGRPGVFGGDLDVPLLDLPPAAQYVLQLSSRQCADLTDSPRVAAVTALFPEDLLAHGGEREYYRDTLNVLRRGPEMIVVNGADLRLRDEIRGICDLNGFPPIPAGADDSRFRVEDEWVHCSDEPLFHREALHLKGAHNGRNLCVALAVLDGLGVDVPGMKDELQAAVESFEGLPHRLAEIADPSGLTFVDDTVSTNPYSAMQAIEAYPSRPLTVLVGGTDRGLDYAPLRQFLTDRELTVIGIPDSGPRIVEELAGLSGVTTEVAEDLPAAVRLARKMTPSGGVVLLSPAAPGYGRYPDIERCSEAFATAVRESA